MVQFQSLTGRRSMARLRLGVEATLDLVSGLRRCVVMDLSCDGARLQLPAPPQAGAFGLLTCDKIEMFGRIVWKRDDLCGMHFDETVDDELILDFRARCDEILASQDTRLSREGLEYARSWVEGR